MYSINGLNQRLYQTTLLCKAKRQYLPTCKVSRYCLYTLDDIYSHLLPYTAPLLQAPVHFVDTLGSELCDLYRTAHARPGRMRPILTSTNHIQNSSDPACTKIPCIITETLFVYHQLNFINKNFHLSLKHKSGTIWTDQTMLPGTIVCPDLSIIL